MADTEDPYLAYCKKYHLEPYSKYIEENIACIRNLTENPPKEEDYCWDIGYTDYPGFIQRQQELISEIYHEILYQVKDEGGFDEIPVSIENIWILELLDIAEEMNDIRLTFKVQFDHNKIYIGYWWMYHSMAFGWEPEDWDGEIGILRQITEENPIPEREPKEVKEKPEYPTLK